MKRLKFEVKSENKLKLILKILTNEKMINKIKIFNVKPWIKSKFSILNSNANTAIYVKIRNVCTCTRICHQNLSSNGLHQPHNKHRPCRRPSVLTLFSTNKMKWPQLRQHHNQLNVPSVKATKTWNRSCAL